MTAIFLKRYPCNICGAHASWFSLECYDQIQLRDLMNDVAAIIPTKWKDVGIQLKLSTRTLDEIQDQNAGKPESSTLSFGQVFIQWVWMDVKKKKLQKYGPTVLCSKLAVLLEGRSFLLEGSSSYLLLLLLLFLLLLLCLDFPFKL